MRDQGRTRTHTQPGWRGRVGRTSRLTVGLTDPWGHHGAGVRVRASVGREGRGGEGERERPREGRQ